VKPLKLLGHLEQNPFLSAHSLSENKKLSLAAFTLGGQENEPRKD
ncbi:uncharacterized protein METZ01_LOCUS274641, partial [marine metagenome]